MPKIRKEAVDTQIGERLRALRLARGLSQADLGKALDISYQQVQKYEKGGNRMSASTLLKVAAFFAIPPQSLLEGLVQNSHGAGEGEDLARLARTPEGAALLKAFQRITDPAARKRLLAFATEMASR
jgi:transcriptional regulator with XRE-family HTH domain